MKVGEQSVNHLKPTTGSQIELGLSASRKDSPLAIRARLQAAHRGGPYRHNPASHRPSSLDDRRRGRSYPVPLRWHRVRLYRLSPDWRERGNPHLQLNAAQGHAPLLDLAQERWRQVKPGGRGRR